MNPLAKVLFRVDASLEIGTGHVMRCLTLAQELAFRGSSCLFVIKNQPNNLQDLIEQQGFSTRVLPTSTNQDKHLAHSSWLGSTQVEDATLTQEIAQKFKPDLVVVDHYALDSIWEEKLQPWCNKVLVIDDLADRKHSCDFLLDQNFGRSPEDYQNLVAQDTQLFIGPKFALLRPEFNEFRQESLDYRKTHQAKKLFINLGGVDKDNFTGQVLQALQKLPALHSKAPLPSYEITLVLGSSSPHSAAIKRLAQQSLHKVKVLQGVKNMAEIMAQQDLAIGAAGSTTWERACLGLPTILLVIAQNQQPAAEALAEIGAAKMAKNPQEIVAILADIDSWQARSSEISRKLTQGLGAKIVCDNLWFVTC